METTAPSKKGTAFSIGMAPLGALALKDDKTVMDLYLALIIAGVLIVYFAVQAILEMKRAPEGAPKSI